MRHRQWQSRLAAVIDGRLSAPFAWGTNDCCMFAADCVQAVTGIDPAAALRGTYSNALEAVAALESLGGIEALADAHSVSRVELNFEHVGDVCIAIIDGRDSLCVWGGDAWLGPSTDGLTTVDASAITAIFRIG